MSSPDNGIIFPIADAGFAMNNRRTRRSVGSIGDQAMSSGFADAIVIAIFAQLLLDSAAQPNIRFAWLVSDLFAHLGFGPAPA